MSFGRIAYERRQGNEPHHKAHLLRFCRPIRCFFHGELLIKRQTADYSDGKAILTLLKYDRTVLFVPKERF